jgi:diguanylate cyclase (GGDEF)-like protein
MWQRGWPARLSIGTKIAGASVAGSVIFALVGMVGQARLHDLSVRQDRESSANTRALGQMTSVRSAVGGQQEAVLSYILSEPGSYRTSYSKAVTSTDQTIDAGIAALTAFSLPDAERANLRELASDVALWRKSRGVALAAAGTGDQQGVVYTIVRLDTVGQVVKQSADDLLDLMIARLAHGARAAAVDSADTAQLMLWLGAVSALLAVMLSLLLARSISRPLAEVIDVLTRVAKGDLSKQVTFHRRDQLGRMGDALNATLAILEGTFHEVHHRATHDSLTGLANRALLHEKLTLAENNVSHAHHSAVILLDLDDFKQVNDMFGHAAGDHLLIVTAQRLLSHVRETDTVARGGDECVVLVHDAPSTSDVQHIVDTLTTAVEEPVEYQGRVLSPQASMGTALLQPGQQADAAMRDADEILYLVKAARKGIPVDNRHGREATLAARLPHALTAGQFAVLYQPLIDLHHRRPVAVEALLRWRHPELGTISPTEFIPVAEHTGIIHTLGLWVLEQSCRQLHRWQADRDCDPETYISVNMSPQQLRSPTIVDDVVTVLHRSGLDPEHLVLEVTESGIVDEQIAIPALTALQARGIRIAIDDFGTGYSSLHHLTRLPVDIVKIDRSLVGELDGTPEHGVIIEAVVRLGQVLHFTTVAEGVETAAQADELQTLDCRIGQGYHWAKPMPADQAGSFLANWKDPRPDPATAAGDQPGAAGERPSGFTPAFPTSSR